MEESHLMSNSSNISFLGLKDNDVLAIKAIISLVIDLNINFKVVDDYNSTDIDILLVNYDDELAVKAYENYKEQTGKTPVLLRCSGGDLDGDEGTLKFPITKARLEEALRNAISTSYESSSVPGDNAESVNAVNTLKVLVVDDSFPVRKYMGEKLPKLVTNINSGNYVNITFASSGREAIEKIKAAKGDFDIVFLDVVMDDVNGYKICTWIKSASKAIKVVMLTSKDSQIDKVRGKLAGCDAYLAKPPPDSKLEDVLVRFWVQK